MITQTIRSFLHSMKYISFVKHFDEIINKYTLTYEKINEQPNQLYHHILEL